MNLVDTLPDGTAVCEFLAAMPHDARLDQLCPTSPVVVKEPEEPLTREEGDAQLSALFEQTSQKR